MPVLARAMFLFVFVVGIVGSVIIGIANRRVGRIYDVPPPSIARATAPEEIARGGRLFRTNCLDCHAGQAVDLAASVGAPAAGAALSERRPTGARVNGTPSFLGEIWAPNLTADSETGIAIWTDGQLARLLRNGLGRDGRYAATMPRFARLADQDVAALIGFLRSADPMLTPVRNSVPRRGLGIAGTLALAYAAGIDTAGAARIPMPPRGPTAAYGGYLASAVYACVDCHTEGFIGTEEKLRSPMLLAGGQFHRTPDGETIYSTNLTPDPDTGSRAHTSAELTRLLTTGIQSDGIPARPPMPVFRFIDADEGAALFAYLRSVPPVARRTAGPARTRPASDDPPERLFATLGCAVCHGGLAVRNDVLKRAAQQPVADIAAIIRDPETRHPGTQMPTYASVLDEPTALRLAAWLRLTGGAGTR